jgi:hypothetical protein
MNSTKAYGALASLALPLMSGCAWQLTGNSGTAAGNEFLGTTDSQPLVIKTNNNEALRIDTNGNVGIGATSFTEKLSVAGIVESTVGGIKFPDGTVQTTAASGASLSKTVRTATTPSPATSCCRTATASCNSDEIVSGGGFSRADDPSLEVFYSRPSANGWSVSMTNYGPATRSIEVFAVCLKLQ